MVNNKEQVYLNVTPLDKRLSSSKKYLLFSLIFPGKHAAPTDASNENTHHIICAETKYNNLVTHRLSRYMLIIYEIIQSILLYLDKYFQEDKKYFGVTKVHP